MRDESSSGATRVGRVFVLCFALSACAPDATPLQLDTPNVGKPAGVAGAPAGVATMLPASQGASTSLAPTAATGAPASATQQPATPAAPPAQPQVATTPATPAAAAPSGGATYQHDIRPIIEARCVGCHVAGGVGPFALDTWENVDKYKTVILPAVMSRRMPPWPADDTNCIKHHNKQRLTDAQLALFTKWQADGFQQGMPSDFAPLVEAEPAPNLGEPDLIVKPTPYQLTANFEGYICSQTDANLTEDMWVRALDVKPEHNEYVHHAIVSLGGGNCDALGTTAENLYSYRPGSRTVVFGEGDAILLPAGKRIAIQFHFNTRGAKPATSYPTDSSPLRLWTLPKGEKPQRQIHRQPIHAFNISIPVGAVDLSVKTSQALEAGSGAEIIGISPHMHLLGQRFHETLSGGGASNTCLVDVPDWDQSWQIDYLFQPSAYIKAMPGMTVSQECRFSNRPEDQGIGPDGKPFTPQFTTYGEDTRNEMCLAYIWYRQPLSGGFN